MKAWNKLIKKISSEKITKGLTSFVNPYSMLILKDYPEIIEKIDYWHIDGISLVNAVHKLTNKKFKRISFDETSLSPVVFKFAKENKLKIALIGTKEEFIQQAVKNIECKHKIKIEYYRNGYFINTHEKLICFDEIVTNNIDIVICGMGTPFQEKFLINLKQYGWNGYGFTCGGYFHQMAKKQDYYPYIFNKLNLRWLYRIIDEPKLIKRYLFDYPYFFYLFKKLN